MTLGQPPGLWQDPRVVLSGPDPRGASGNIANTPYLNGYRHLKLTWRHGYFLNLTGDMQ